MGSLIDYLSWRGDISFAEMGINQVDNLIFSELSYINFEDIVPLNNLERIPLSEAAERYFALYPVKKKKMGMLPVAEFRELLKAAAETERFKNAELWGYVNEVDKPKETQFSALCYSIPGNRTYLAYRGTDNSIAGWKENFNMAFMFPVPAQERAAEYIKWAAAQTGDILHIGGHSKGGNLAEYAATEAGEAIQLRIEHIWSNDGPGFMQDFLQRPEYKAIKPRITKIMPESSLVGVLLDSDCESIIIESDAFGPKQHEGFSWQVQGGSFIRGSQQSSGSKLMDETADAMIKTMSLEQRKEFIEAVFAAVYATGADTLSELFTEGFKPRELAGFFGSIEMEPEVKEKFMRALMSSFKMDERITNFIFNRKKQLDKKQ